MCAYNPTVSRLPHVLQYIMCLCNNTFYEGQLGIVFLKMYSLYAQSRHIHNTPTYRQHVMGVVIPSLLILQYLLMRWLRWSSISVWYHDRM